MNETETTLSQIATQISEAIEEKEAQKGEVEPAAIPALDREIGMLKRKLQNIQDSERIQETAAHDTEGETLDEITKAKLVERKLYEEAVAAGVDFNNHADPMLVSAHRLSLTIELVDMLSDVINTNKERTQPFPDMGYFTKPLDEAIAIRAEQVNQARKKVDAAAEEEQKFESELQEAKAAGEVEKIIVLTDQLEDAKKITQCLRGLLADEEKKKALSAGDTLAAWDKVCEVYGYEWRNRLQAVLLAAQIYHENLQQLNELNNNLWQVRKNIQNIGEQNGDPDNRIKNQKITCNLPDMSHVMGMEEEARLMATVFFRRGEML